MVAGNRRALAKAGIPVMVSRIEDFATRTG
jgi:hypothetical protein